MYPCAYKFVSALLEPRYEWFMMLILTLTKICRKSQEWGKRTAKNNKNEMERKVCDRGQETSLCYMIPLLLSAHILTHSGMGKSKHFVNLQFTFLFFLTYISPWLPDFFSSSHFIIICACYVLIKERQTLNGKRMMVLKKILIWKNDGLIRAHFLFFFNI